MHLIYQCGRLDVHGLNTSLSGHKHGQVINNNDDVYGDNDDVYGEDDDNVINTNLVPLTYGSDPLHAQSGN